MKIAISLALVAAVSGCSSENAGGASSAAAQASGKAAKSASAAPAAKSAAPAKTEAAPTASAAAPIDVKPANVPGNLGITMTLKPGAMEGDSYKAKAEVENKGPKEVTAVAWRVCGYDASGKLQVSDTVNGGDVAAKPNAKGELEVWVKPSPLVGFRITSAKFADGSNKEPDFADRNCPETIQP